MTTRTLPRTGEKRTSKLKYQILTGLMAAMITLMTAYLCHIPTGINGGYIHLGDAVIYLAAALLPTPSRAGSSSHRRRTRRSADRSALAPCHDRYQDADRAPIYL